MNWFHGPLVEAFGWTLLHSFWQFSLVAAAVAIGLAAMHRSSAQLRYLLCCTALLVMTALAIGTFAHCIPPLPASATPATAPETAITMAPSSSPMVYPLTIVQAPRPTSAAWMEDLRSALPYVVFAHWAVALALSLRLLAGYLHLRRLRRAAIEAEPDTRAIFISLLNKMGITGSVKLLESAQAEVPMVLGVFKPIVLLPLSLASAIPPEQLLALLAHELAHIRRFDAVANLIQSILETIFFYHPAVWWLSARIRQEREFCCDDAATAICGNRLTYAKALAELEGQRGAGKLALAAKDGEFLGRIQRILQSKRSRRPTFSSPLVLTMLILLFTGMAACAKFGHAGETPAATTATEPATLSTQIYDVRDLLLLPNPAAAATTQPDAQTQIAATNMQHLIEMIRKNIAPDSWNDPHVNLATDDRTRQLIITQTPDNQKQIADWLMRYRQGHLTQVLVSTGIALVDEQTLLTIAGGKMPPKQADGQSALFTPDTSIAGLLKIIAASKDSTILSAPRLSLFTAQPAVITMGQEIKYISGYTFPASGDPTPQLSTLKTGLDLPLVATIGDDHKTIVVKFDFTLQQLLRMDSAPVQHAPPAYKNLTIEVPIIDKQELSTKMAITDGATGICFAKLNNNIQPGDPLKTSPGPHYLVLLITPKVLKPNEEIKEK